MKLSNYTIVTSLGNDYFLYHTLSGALAECSKEQWDTIDEYCKSSNASPKMDSKLQEQLEYGSFIVPKGKDELNELKKMYDQLRLDADGLGLTICPTLGCNFRCAYCFEHTQDDITKMTLETQKKLMDFVKMKSPSRLSVTWFGGEPLLAVDVMENLSSMFYSYCDENDVIYDAFLITNGYLLNEEIVTRLKNIGIHRLQITVDGSEESHNRSRPLKSRGKTYERIIKNIKAFAAEDFFIHIRINIDRENKNEIYSVLDKFSEEELKYLSIGLGYVDNLNDRYNDENCLELEEFYTQTEKFAEELAKRSPEHKVRREEEIINLPSFISNVCGADRLNSYGISVNGTLHKCWNHFGYEDYSIGNLDKFLEENQDQAEKSMEDAFLSGFESLSKDCLSCSLLPACLGGCIDERVKKNTHRCHSLIYNTEVKLQSAIKVLKKGGPYNEVFNSTC